LLGILRARVGVVEDGGAEIESRRPILQGLKLRGPRRIHDYYAGGKKSGGTDGRRLLNRFGSSAASLGGRLSRKAPLGKRLAMETQMLA
jgi:hypothetical protein